MATDNTVHPEMQFQLRDGTQIIVIKMRMDRYSVGIVEPDSKLAKFVWDWDEEPRYEADRIAVDLKDGHYGRISDVLQRGCGFYTMPYPIQRKSL